MSSFEYENYSDGEWDDRGDLAWNEYDWQQYLKQNDQEISRFLSFYNKLKHQPDHLDDVAHLMGWDSGDWAPGDESSEQSSWDEKKDDEDGPDEDLQPYTIHKHPVFIVTRGLYQNLYHVWEQYSAQGLNHIFNPAVTWKFAASLHAGEINAIMAINALDMGDYSLAICHLKNALSAINHSFSILQNIPQKTPTMATLHQEATIALFDLREVWLRVMNDCREENRRRKADGDKD